MSIHSYPSEDEEQEYLNMIYGEQAPPESDTPPSRPREPRKTSALDEIYHPEHAYVTQTDLITWMFEDTLIPEVKTGQLLPTHTLYTKNPPLFTLSTVDNTQSLTIAISRKHAAMLAETFTNIHKIYEAEPLTEPKKTPLRERFTTWWSRHKIWYTIVTVIVGILAVATLVFTVSGAFLMSR